MESNPKSPTYDASTFKFLRRFSSIKVDYDKGRRKTLSKYQTQGLKAPCSSPIFSQDKKQIHEKLRHSIKNYSLDELYVKMICALFPNLKSRETPDSNALVQYLKKVFRLTEQKHSQLMDVAKMTKLPQRIINLEIVEAKDLPAKDTNGLSDPFCVLFLNSRDNAQRTKIIHGTLTPIWKEYFKFKVNDPYRDVLCIEIMDYNKDAEPLRDRIRKLKEIKSPSTLGVLLREFANARSVQELIGSLKIPVSDISSETFERWFKLKNHEDKGEVYIRMALGYNKSKESATEEFYQIVHSLLIHELGSETALAAPFHWDEHYEMWSKYILRQFKWQGALKPKDIVLTKLRAYAVVNEIFPLNANMMCLLLDSVLERSLNGEYDGVEVTKFWESGSILVKSIITFLQEIHDVLPCPVTVLHTYHMLKTIELFNQYLCRPGSSERGTPPFSKAEIIDSVIRAVRDGAEKFYIKVFSDSTHESASNDAMLTALERLLKMGQILHEDLRLGFTTIHTDFKGILNIDYMAITYKVYDHQFGKMVRYIMDEYNGKLYDYSESEMDSEEPFDEEDPGVKTVLAVLKLYLAVKNLTEHAPIDYMIDEISENSLKKGFHEWFFHSVATWIDILRKRIIKWVKNSINLSEGSGNETVETCTDSKLSRTDKQDTKEVPISSSAFDTAQMFLEIHKFWMSLGWENPNQSFVIVRKILEELYGYLVYYASQLLKSMELTQPSSEDIMEPDQIYPYLYKTCTSVNNVNYVKEQVEILATQLNFPDIIERIAAEKLSVNEEYEEKIDLMKIEMETQVEKVIFEMRKKCISLITPKYLKLLQALSNEPTNKSCFRASVYYNELQDFVETCLTIFHQNLEKGNFDEFLITLWKGCIEGIDQNVSRGLEGGKQNGYFHQCKDLLGNIYDLFWPQEVELTMKIENPSIFQPYSDMKQRLSYLEMPFEELKVNYYQARFQRQQTASVTQTEHGLVTIRAGFVESPAAITVELLSARNLKSYDSNDLSDPYAIVTLNPKELSTTPSFTSKCHKETLFPLFEEKFTFSLSSEELKKQGFLQISLYDYDFIGKDQFMGEVLLPFSNIQKLSKVDEIGKLPQLHLVLCKPDSSEDEILKKFEERSWDKESLRYAKLEREKMK